MVGLHTFYINAKRSFPIEETSFFLIQGYRLRCVYISYATFSNRFIMMNMKAAERMQSTRNTAHTTHRGKSPQRIPPMATRKLPMAVATNQPPIIIPLYFGGATFETNEIPIGESRSSANVKIRYVPISQLADATGPSCPLSARAFCSFGVSSPCEAIIITKKATAATNIP